MDPQTKTITETEILNRLEDYYATLGCEMVQWVPVGDGDDGIFCDEEGLFDNNALERGLTEVRGVLGMVIGRFIVVGPADDEGNTMSTTMTIPELETLIQWVPSRRARVYLDCAI